MCSCHTVYQNWVPAIHEIYWTLDPEYQGGNSCKNMKEPMRGCNSSQNVICGKCYYPGGIDDGISLGGPLYEIRQQYL